MTDAPISRVEPRPTHEHYQRDDVLTPDEVRAAIGPFSDRKWDDVKARIPWSDQLGPRSLRIRWGRLLEWMESSERRVA